MIGQKAKGKFTNRQIPSIHIIVYLPIALLPIALRELIKRFKFITFSIFNSIIFVSTIQHSNT